MVNFNKNQDGSPKSLTSKTDDDPKIQEDSKIVENPKTKDNPKEKDGPKINTTLRMKTVPKSIDHKEKADAKTDISKIQNGHQNFSKFQIAKEAFSYKLFGGLKIEVL